MFIITFCFYFLLIAALFLYGTRSIGLSFVIIWWGMWNLISYLSLSGLYTIEFNTQCVYYLFFALFVFSYIVFEKKFGDRFNKQTNFSNQKDFYSVLLWISIFFILPIQLFFAGRAIYILNYVMTPKLYRNDVFGLLTGSAMLFFNSNKLALLHALVIGPFQYVYLFTGLSFFLLRKKVGLLIVGVTLVVLDSLIMFGRFGYHYLIISVLLCLIFVSYFNGFAILRRNLLKALLPLFLLLFLTLGVTSYRGSRSLIKIFDLFVVTYHTESFSIFDVEMRNPNSILHHYSYGLSMLGGVERYWVLILNKIGIEYLSQTDIVGGYLHQNFNIGVDRLGDPILLNAYGSIFFTMYRDGGMISVAIFGILFGILFSHFSISIKNRDPYRFSILLGLMFILIYGIFQPTTLGPMLPGLFFLVLLMLVIRFYRLIRL